MTPEKPNPEEPIAEKPEQENDAEKNQQDYDYLINSYHRTTLKMKAIQRRYPVPGDSELIEKIHEMDTERHEIHIRLLEIGGKLGKDKGDILVDIVREQRTLEEYGLPEFSILTEEDIIKTDDYHQPYYFNLDTDRDSKEDWKTDWKGRSDWESIRSDEKKEDGIPKDTFMLVFAIVPIEGYGGDELEPEDYTVRLRRARRLAKQMGGEVFEKRDSGYHEATAKILGVIFPKKDMEKVAGVIRSNPERFRLGQEFYSKNETDFMKSEDKEGLTAQ